MRPCNCGSGEPSWWLLDANGIETQRVCVCCIEEVRSHYQPWVFDGYDQSDLDEPIEAED